MINFKHVFNFKDQQASFVRFQNKLFPGSTPEIIHQIFFMSNRSSLGLVLISVILLHMCAAQLPAHWPAHDSAATGTVGPPLANASSASMVNFFFNCSCFQAPSCLVARCDSRLNAARSSSPASAASPC